MTNRRCALLIAFALLASPALWGQATVSSISKQLDGLRAVPDPQRPAATTKIANDIRTLPPGLPKLKLADSLTHLATEGDPGQETLQAVADTLAQALKETPQPPLKDGRPAMPFTDLAKLARYEGITTDFKDPMLSIADDILVANDADVAKAETVSARLGRASCTIDLDVPQLRDADLARAEDLRRLRGELAA